MHHLMLTTLEMPDDHTSLAARIDVQNILQGDPSFGGDGGRFGSPLCDWFVIGGRWSGELKETLIGEPYKTAFACEFPELAKGWYRPDLVDKHRERLNELWHSFGGTGDSPLLRTRYDFLGCEDDAMLVDQALFDHFLAGHLGESIEIEGSSGTFADLDNEAVDASFIGRKWLVVVDYHS